MISWPSMTTSVPGANSLAKRLKRDRNFMPFHAATMQRLALVSGTSAMGGVAVSADLVGVAGPGMHQPRQHAPSAGTPPATRSCAPCMASSCRRCLNLRKKNGRSRKSLNLAGCESVHPRRVRFVCMPRYMPCGIDWMLRWSATLCSCQC